MNDKTSTEQTADEAPATRPPAKTLPPPASKPRGRKGLWFTLVLTLGVALAAASAAGLLWWQQRQSEAAMAQADSAAAQSAEEIRSAVESLEEDVGTLQRSDAAQLEASGRFGANVDELSIRFETLQSRVDDFQGITADARRRWLLAEAEHYLSLGNAELSLGGHWETAIVALELADDALRQLAEPAFAPVRQQVSADLQTLRSTELVDVEGLSYTLGRLAVRVDELPMGPSAPGNLIAEPQGLADVESGWNRVWLSIRGAISGMISVERSDASESPALTVREQSLIRRQLELELEMARLGLLRNQSQVFLAAVETAADLLTGHFDVSEQAVQSAVTLLDEMVQLDIAPARPDISGSLSLLRELAARDG
ncbi:MAG: uroporphyrinogen-III C-methyltransferase [Rhodospirillaceae bacterium]|nr:uroporphyrinogen-III C-methyltransferase [Rhodospirillaceae bacterium]